MSKPEFTWITPVVCVTDLTNSLEYYRDILGFEISWQWSEDQEFEENAKPTFACVGRGEASIFLCENGQGSPGSWIFLNVINRDELDSIFQEYKESDANILQEPMEYSWGMCELLVSDQDGNTFRIGCPIESKTEAKA